LSSRSPHLGRPHLCLPRPPLLPPGSEICLLKPAFPRSKKVDDLAGPLGAQIAMSAGVGRGPRRWVPEIGTRARGPCGFRDHNGHDVLMALRDREVEEIVYRGRFCKIGVLVFCHVQHDRGARLVRKRVNTAKSKSQGSLSQLCLKNGIYVLFRIKVRVF
jgi:hypothetical protein